MVFLFLLFDALSVLGALVIAVVLVRRNWPVWLAYSSCALGWVVYANTVGRVIGFNPSMQMVTWVGWMCDSLIFWHEHQASFQNGHTDAEYAVLITLLPIVGLVVLPAILLYVGEAILILKRGRRRTSTRDDSESGGVIGSM